jgi:hypothetical protein
MDHQTGRGGSREEEGGGRERERRAARRKDVIVRDWAAGELLWTESRDSRC